MTRYFLFWAGNALIPNVLGKTIPLNERPYQIIGVMGPDFRFPRTIDLWAPLGLAPAAFTEANRFNESYNAYALVRAGVPFERANAFIQVLADRLKASGTQGSRSRTSRTSWSAS